MAKDERLYAKLTLDFADNPKVLPLSDAAFRCLVEATLYSRRMMSDGFLPSRLALAKWGVDVLEELATNDPERPSLVKLENGWQIHNFAEHQDTRAEIEARTARNKANGSLGGQARAKRLANQPAKQKRSEPQAETETETETTTTSNEVVERASRRKTESPLPESWEPPVSAFDYADENGIDMAHEVEQFRNHAKANDRRQRDWDASFRTWLGNAKKFSRPPDRPRTTAAQRNLATVAHFEQQALELEQ